MQPLKQTEQVAFLTGFKSEITMPLSIPYASLTRTVAFCAIGILLGSPSFGQDSHPNDYIRSTRTLKSGGSITTLSSQGQTRSWVNQPTTAPNARVASRDVGSNAPRSSSSTSFYRQAQSNGTGEPTYPYPCLLYTSPSPRDKRQSRMPSSA